jgi:hypothetical protein
VRHLVPGLICVTVLASGCDDGQPESEVRQISVAQNSPHQQRLKEMDPRLRNAAFMRAIRDARESCNRVEQSAHTGSYQDIPMWSARCSGGSEYALFIGADGSVQVRSCEHVRQLDMPPCRFVPEDGMEESGAS